jgi:hypothetical protein
LHDRTLLLIILIIRRRYAIHGASVKDDNFLAWETGQTRRIYFELREKSDRDEGQKDGGKGKGREREPARQFRRIPEGYARLIHQLILEVQHGGSDSGHESERRMMYAGRVLDKFVEELKPFPDDGPGADWRSIVLTPILQRQMIGIPDSYSWSVNRAVVNMGYDEEDSDPDEEEFTDDMGDEEDRLRPTIAQATRAYLAVDPLDPEWIPSYRRNLLYVREMRWHLSVVSVHNKYTVSQVPIFDVTIKNSDFLHEFVSNQMKDNPSPDSLLLPELIVIVSEGIEKFYESEISRLVCYSSLSFYCFGAHRHPIL